MFLILLLLGTASAFNFSGHSTSIDVLGQSGKVTIKRGFNVITMQMDKLYEVANNEYIGTTGQNKHSVTAFANQDFEFTPLQTVTYKNVSVDEFYFYSTIYNIGILDVRTMLVNNQSSLGTSTEKWAVEPGDIKWNIELRNWEFLPEADSIELHIEIKGNKPVGNTTSKDIDIGGATLQLSNRVVIDDVEQDMPQGFPKVIQKGSKDFYIFRFPRFTNKAIYDPVLQFATVSSGSKHIPAFLGMLFITLLLCLYDAE